MPWSRTRATSWPSSTTAAASPTSAPPSPRCSATAPRSSIGTPATRLHRPRRRRHVPGPRYPDALRGAAADRRPATRTASRLRLRHRSRRAPHRRRHRHRPAPRARRRTASCSTPVTSRSARQLEADLRHQALHDSLTGLANRTMFTETGRPTLRPSGAGVGRRAVHRPRRLQDRQRQPRPRRRRRAARRRGRAPHRRLPADAIAGPPRRRRVRRAGGRRPTTRLGAGRRWPCGCSTTCAGPFASTAARSWSPPASASPPSTTRAPPPRSCCATPTWPCTWPRSGARTASSCSRSAMHASAFERLELKADLARGHRRRASSRCVYQPDRLARRPAASPASRRSSAGTTPAGAVSPPTPSSRSPRTPASSSRSASGCCEEACQQLRAWQLAPARRRRPVDEREPVGPPARARAASSTTCRDAVDHVRPRPLDRHPGDHRDHRHATTPR